MATVTASVRYAGDAWPMNHSLMVVFLEVLWVFGPVAVMLDVDPCERTIALVAQTLADFEDVQTILSDVVDQRTEEASVADALASRIRRLGCNVERVAVSLGGQAEGAN